MNRLLGIAITLLSFSNSSVGLAQDFFVADQAAWPGKIISLRASGSATYWQRGAVPERLTPRVSSITNLPDGSIAFCSGLDRSIMVLGPAGERELHHGGYLARQVRTDTNGDLYWSGLETPQNNNPLPDGFVYRRSAATGQVETVLTFSQADVDRDWWGAFDVCDGQVFIATLRSPAKLYRLNNSIPQLIATLPISLSSFRITNSGTVLAADGQGKLYRFNDWRHPEQFDLVVQREFAFSDFLAIP